MKNNRYEELVKQYIEEIKNDEEAIMRIEERIERKHAEDKV